MNLFEKVTAPYVTDEGPVVCHHPNMIRTVRTSRYGSALRQVFHIARCPDCPALAASPCAAPYVAPMRMERAS